MSEEAEVVVVDLPEDVVLKIQCRLPVKSLIRFTCVSKRWRSIIISDLHFAKSTFQLASQAGALSPRNGSPLESTHIFSTKDNSWKIIGAPHSSFPHENRPLLVSNGACRWVVRYGVSKQALHAFHLVQEEFRQLSLPLALMVETAPWRWVDVKAKANANATWSSLIRREHRRANAI
ncbi:uncharacterized protein LOC126797373 [Argentina anserina]|uniref:uncharacterized protein LOC126797373 n=1 Tax=Argentina anserina TaxID=57926 RepID=UPI00217656E3|nr:uncharacterized protein LOC126797373 [Potentilla anserina]